MRLRLLSLVLILSLFAVAATAETVKSNAKKERWVEGQVLVKYRSGFAPEGGKHGVKKSKKTFDRFRLKGKAQQHSAARGLDRVYLLEVDDVGAALARLSKDPAVEYAEPNWLLTMEATPNDPSYSAQWSLAKIGAPAAWDTATSGTGVVIGVVDTGIDLTHPDLAANLWTNPGEIAGNNIDDDDNGFVDDVHGWDFGDDDANPTDTEGHGTMVAGVIGAVGNNATGVSGVVWTAKLAALRIGSGTPSVYAAVQAIEYANAMGFRITNNSYGWWEGGQSFLFDDVIAVAEAQGNLFVAAAGNDGHDNDQLPHYPSHYTNGNVISVTATTSTDVLWSSGNYGAQSVDLGAPGAGIETTARGGGYTNTSGTSFAAPLVAGAAALYWTANPSLTAAQVREALLLHSEPVASLHGSTLSGGRLSLSNLFDTEATAPDAISDVTVLDTTFRSVTLRFTATGDDGATGRAARYDVRVSTSPLTASNWAQATQLAGEPIPALPGTLESFRLTGLAASTTYYLGVRAIDNAGNSGALSNVVTLTTTRAAVLFDDNVEDGVRGWTVAGTDGNGGAALWHIANREWSYLRPGSGYDTGAANSGTLTSRAIDLTQATDARLQFRHDLWTQRMWGRDVAQVQLSVDGGAWQTVLVKLSTDYEYRTESIDLSAYSGHSIRVRFSFDTVDAALNVYPGWQVDDVRIEATSTNAPPVAVINVPAVTEEQAATLTSTGSSDPDGAALEYKWSFGDGTFAYTTATSVTHTWTREGTYTVTLTAFDGSNSSDPVTALVTPIPFNDRPVAGISMAFAPPPHLEETNIYVTYFDSTDEENAPLTCRFDYGDGQTMNVPCSGSWPHQWMAPGTYTITLIVNDGVQDSLPDTQSITIAEATNDRPVARAGGPYDAHPNETITLDGTASSDEETSVASYLWTFADATTSAAPQPAKAFATPGNHDVSLVVTDQTSLVSTAASARVRVCGGAAAGFFPNPIYTCPGGTARVGVNVGSGILPLTLTWGDGFVQQITSLSNGYYAERVVTPSGPASYTLASLTDFLGCPGTVGTGTASVGFATATLSGSRTICPGQSTTLEAQFTGNGPFDVTWSDGFTATYTNAFGTHTVSPTETTVYSIASMTCASCPPGTTGVTSGTFTVTVAEPLSGVVSGGGSTCSSGAYVPVSVEITGGYPPFTVQWSDGTTTTTSTRTATRTVRPASTTTYTATSVTGGSCSGPVSGSAAVSIVSPPTAVVSGGGGYCAGSSATVTATLTGTAPFTLTWNDGTVQTVAAGNVATRQVSPASQTYYFLTSVSDASCSGSSSGSVSAFRREVPHANITGGGGTFCAGGTSSISFTVTAGIGPFQVTWSDGFTQTLSGSFGSRQVSPESATTYTIASVTDAYCSGGTSSGSATATPRARPTAVVSGGGYLCNGTQTVTATLTGTAPFIVTWSDGQVQQTSSSSVTRTVTTSSETVFTVTALSDASCSGGTSTGSATVTARPQPTATVNGGGSFCAGGSATIGATFTGIAPFTIVWSDGVTETTSANSISRTVAPAVQTEYRITSFSDAYCSRAAGGTALVTPRPVPTATLTGGGTFCAGTAQTMSVALTGTSPFTITWSDGVTQTVNSGTTATRSVTPATATTYTIASVRDFFCTAGTTSGSAAFTPVAKPTAVVSGGGAFCPATTATVTATLTGSAPFSLTWSDGFTQTVSSGNVATRQVSPASSTTYVLTAVSDASSCSGTWSGNAVAFPRAVPTATVSGGGTSCGTGTVQISASLTGTGPYSVTWSDGVTQTTSAGINTLYRNVNPASTTTYTVTAMSDAYCSGTSSGSATVTPRAVPAAVVTGGGNFCPGGSVTIGATLTGTAPFTLTWNDGVTQTIPSGNTATRTVSPASATTYQLNSFSDAYCTGTRSGSAVVTPRPAPTAVVSGSGTYCEGTTRSISAALTGTAPFALTWSDGFTQTVAGGNVATRNVSPAAPTTYSVTAVSDAYCTGTASGSATVTRIAAPTAAVSGGGSFCSSVNGTTITATLTGTAPFTVRWSDNVQQTTSASSVSRTVNPASTTVYTVVQISDASCLSGTATGSATATPLTAPSAVVSGGGSYCAGSPVTLTATLSGSGPFNITWSDGFTQQVTGTTATRSVSPSTATTYTITSLTNDGCSGTASGSATVTPRATPTAVVSGGGAYCEGATTTVTATFTGTAPFSVTWSDGVSETTSSNTLTRSVGPSATTVYTLTSFTDAYCSGTRSGSATATPTLKPVITTQPQNKTIAANTATTLTVAATGTALNYQWYKGPAGTTTTPVGTGPSFTTPKLKVTTQYWVRIWTTGCTAYPTNSQTATVTVP